MWKRLLGVTEDSHAFLPMLPSYGSVMHSIQSEVCVGVQINVDDIKSLRGGCGMVDNMLARYTTRLGFDSRSGQIICTVTSRCKAWKTKKYTPLKYLSP